jgi:DUF2961 family protein
MTMTDGWIFSYFRGPGFNPLPPMPQTDFSKTIGMERSPRRQDCDPLVQVIQPDGLYHSQQRFGLYRWHIPDPVRFNSELRVTIQALGWRNGDKYLPLRDDISSVAFWYQTEPHAAFPKLPGKEQLQIN